MGGFYTSEVFIPCLFYTFPPSGFHTASAGLEIPRKAPWQKHAKKRCVGFFGRVSHGKKHLKTRKTNMTMEKKQPFESMYLLFRD